MWLIGFWGFGWFFICNGISWYVDDDVYVLEGAYVGGEVYVPVSVKEGKYCNVI